MLSNRPEMTGRFTILGRAPSRNHDRASSSRHTASLAECIDWRSRILKRIEAGDYIEALIRIRQHLHFADAEVSSGQAFARGPQPTSRLEFAFASSGRASALSYSGRKTSALYRVVSEYCDAKPTAYCLSSIRRLGTQRRSRPITQYDGLQFRPQLGGAGRAWAHFPGPAVSVRQRQVDAPDLHHRQLIKSALI